MISHLALIMDGNRRWAKKHGLVSWLGHRQGAKNVEMAIQYCLDYKIANLSLYTLSLENLLNRSKQEQSYIFLLIKEAQSKIDQFIKAQIKIKFIGDLSVLPDDIYQTCLQMEALTAQGTKLKCNFLFCYGGQQEIIAAAQRIVDSQEKIVTVDLFRQHLWSGNVVDPEIIIRTGGVQRLSNFLLFQAAYSEIRFLNCLWPDLARDLLHQTVQECLDTQKNFGK